MGVSGYAPPSHQGAREGGLSSSSESGAQLLLEAQTWPARPSPARAAMEAMKEQAKAEPRGQLHDPQEWCRHFKAAGDGTPRPDMKTIRGMRAKVWRQSDQAVRDGGYRLPDGRWVNLQVAPHPSTCEHEVVSPGASGSGTDDSVIHQAQAPLSTVTVVREDCLMRAMQLQREVGSVAVLNVANASTPGGDYRSGAGTPEEDLHRRTDLWRCPHSAFYPSSEAPPWCPGR